MQLLFGRQQAFLQNLNESSKGALPFCEGPGNLHGRIISSLRPGDLSCPLRPCPKHCRCERQPWNRVVLVRCTGQLDRLHHRREVPALPVASQGRHVAMARMSGSKYKSDGYSYVFDYSKAALPSLLNKMPRLYAFAKELDLSWTQLENISFKAFVKLKKVNQ